MADEPRDMLMTALRQHAVAGSEAEYRQAVLSLHQSLSEAFRSHLAHLGHHEIDPRDVNFPDLIDLIRDHTTLFQDDPKLPPLLGALNNTRNQIAHPLGDEPSPQQIARDADQFAMLIRRFWPGLFGEDCPVPLVSPAPRPPVQRKPVVVPESHYEENEVTAPEAQRPSHPSDLGRFLRNVWKDEREPRLRKVLFLKRVIGIAILFIFGGWCYSFALTTARWPDPVKYAGLVLLLLSTGLTIWALLLIWKALRQLRLRGLLIIFGAGYLLFIAASLLTSDSDLPAYEQAWSSTKRLLVSAADGIREAGQDLIHLPEEFRFAYTGHRRAILLPGMDPEDSAYLTPIPANLPARLSLTAEALAAPTRPATQVGEDGAAPSPPGASDVTHEGTSTADLVPTATFIPLLPPDCPHAQVRLTAPKVNQVIRDQVQVEGTASIENFDYYKFEIKREDIEDEWHWLESFSTPVEAGVLGVWQVGHLPAGTYIFRLTVVDRTANYPPPCEVRVYVRH